MYRGYMMYINKCLSKAIHLLRKVETAMCEDDENYTTEQVKDLDFVIKTLKALEKDIR